MKILKKVIMYVSNFFLVICIFALTSLLIFSNTILSKKYVTKRLEKNNYYGKTQEKIQEEFVNYAAQIGFDKSIVENLYDSEKLKTDVDMMINTIYKNEALELDTEILGTTLDARINEKLEQENKKVSDKDKEAIEKFKKDITNVYKSNVVYSQKYITQIGEQVVKISKIVTISEIVLVFIVIAFVLGIVAISRNVREILRVIGTALLGAGAIIAFVKIFIGSRFNNMFVLSEAFSENLVYLINGVTNRFLVVGIVTAILGIIGIVIR